MTNRTGKSSAKKAASPGEQGSPRPAGLAKTGAGTGAPSADDVPATAGMLRGLRTEMFERLDQTKHELRSEIQQTKHELRAEIQQTKHELRAEIQGLRVELKGDIGATHVRMDTMSADIAGIHVQMHAMKADIHSIKADVARISVIIEEQNARNKVVLDAIAAWLDRQERTERRLDSVEETVRSLASTRPPT